MFQKVSRAQLPPLKPLLPVPVSLQSLMNFFKVVLPTVRLNGFHILKLKQPTLWTFVPLSGLRVWDTRFEFSEDWNIWCILEVNGEARKYCGGTRPGSGSTSALGGSGELLCPPHHPQAPARLCTFSTL